jgi:hypothetical protein
MPTTSLTLQHVVYWLKRARPILIDTEWEINNLINFSDTILCGVLIHWDTYKKYGFHRNDITDVALWRICILTIVVEVYNGIKDKRVTNQPLKMLNFDEWKSLEWPQTQLREKASVLVWKYLAHARKVVNCIYKKDRRWFSWEIRIRFESFVMAIQRSKWYHIQ